MIREELTNSMEDDELIRLVSSNADTSNQYVIFRNGEDELYGINVAKVEELIVYNKLTIAKGNDNNNGSKQKPWKTITHGINSITGGEKLIILSSIYKEKIEIENKGKNDNRIYIEGESKSSTIIDGTSINRDLIFFNHCNIFCECCGKRVSFSSNTFTRNIIYK